MNTYILLRDNKQTGPLSLDEIRQMGVKKYDLIWVEGKSAAWRYPSEIEEMKPFAPPVDEQPYDRFFRKPVHEEHYQLQQLQKIKESHSEDKLPEKHLDERKIPKRKYVAVSLPRVEYSRPESVKNNFQAKMQESFLPENKEERPKLEPIFPGKIDGLSNQKPNETIPVLQTNTFSDRNKSKSSFNSQDLIQYAALGMGVSSILLIGFLLYGNITADPVTVPVQKTTIHRPVPPPVTEEPKMQSIPAVNNLPINETRIEEPVATIRKSAENKKVEEPVKQEIIFPADETSLSVNPVPENSTPVVNLNKLVNASMEDYRVNLFGGIDDVKVKLTNNSSFKLDLVVVELQYVLANKKIYRTENIQFKNIEPGASSILAAPESARGIKVNSRVTYITSAQAGVSENL